MFEEFTDQYSRFVCDICDEEIEYGDTYVDHKGARYHCECFENNAIDIMEEDGVITTHKAK